MPLYLPEKCLRDRKDCKPLAQIESDSGGDFCCCGKNDGTTRVVKQDEFRFCWKTEWTDEMTDCDKRDIIDTISVLAQALSIEENIGNETTGIFSHELRRGRERFCW